MKAFTQPLHDLSEYDQIVSDLAGQRTPIHIDGCIDSQKCHLISSIGEPYPFKLIVTYNEIKAKEIYEDYRFFDRNVYYYPAKDIIFYNADIHSNLIVSQRMAVIRRMMDGCPVTVVTTIDGLSDRLLPLEELQKNRCVFKVGDILPLEALSRKLTALGFERVSQVAVSYTHLVPHGPSSGDPQIWQRQIQGYLDEWQLYRQPHRYQV